MFPSRARLIEIARTEVRLLTTLALVVLVVATLAGFLARLHPYLDWFASFRHIYAAIALVAAVATFRHARRTAAVAVAVVTINTAALVPWTPVMPVTCEPDATALAINALAPHSDHDALLQMIEDEDPEILWVSELSPELAARIAARYPHHVWSEENAYIGLFTKYPIVSSTYEYSPARRPNVNAVVDTPNGALRVLGVHTMAPLYPEASLDRNESLRQLAETARQSVEPVVLLGDLNITMYSPFYIPLEKAGLRNSRLARGVAATWPAALPMRIPIDHVLTSRDLEVCDVAVGPDFESDHLPLRASLAWKKTAAHPRLASR